jgi:hypothetical protein
MDRDLYEEMLLKRLSLTAAQRAEVVREKQAAREHHRVNELARRALAGALVVGAVVAGPLAPAAHAKDSHSIEHVAPDHKDPKRW